MEQSNVRDMLRGLNLQVNFRATGRKSSEGDGRTAADIEKELAVGARREEN